LQKDKNFKMKMSFDTNNETKSSTSQEVIVISTTSIVIILGISNFCFLLKQKNKIPFSNISPILLLITITGKK